MDLGRISGTYGQYIQTFNLDNNNLPPAYLFDGVADVQWAQIENLREFKGNQYNTRIDYQATNKDKFTVSTYIVPSMALRLMRAHKAVRKRTLIPSVWHMPSDLFIHEIYLPRCSTRRGLM